MLPSFCQAVVCCPALCCMWQYTPGCEGYSTLAKEVQDWEHQPECPAGRLFYLALPPYVYPQVGSNRV